MKASLKMKKLLLTLGVSSVAALFARGAKTVCREDVADAYAVYLRKCGC